jgi:Tol biopolymer transport system component
MNYARGTIRSSAALLVVVGADEKNPHRITRNVLYEMVYVMRADGSGRRRLTRTDGELAAWSPDGCLIAYGSPSGLVVIGRAERR